MRYDSKENLQDSAPCQECLNTIIYLNVKRIVFSSKDNTFISENPKNLTIQHTSAGNKFLKKEKIKQQNQNQNQKQKQK